jgi:hypothetical protein
MSDKLLLTTGEAAGYIRVSEALFRRVVDELQVEPDGYYIAYKKRCPKWSLETVEEISSSDQIQKALKMKSQKRSQLPPALREIEENADQVIRRRILNRKRS